MIQIKNDKLSDIESNYSIEIVTKMLERIDNMEQVLSFLESDKEIFAPSVEGKFQSYRKVLKLVLSDKPYLIDGVADDTNRLLHNINNYRGKLPDRIAALRRDANILNDEHRLLKIVSSNAADLKKLQEDFKNSLKRKYDENFIKYIFSYEDYYNHISSIAKLLEINVCPYCNRNYITYIQDFDRKIIGPTFDHFFDKGKNIFLAVSFFNLIPSCYLCNANLKGNKTFSLDTHLHPYYNEMGSNAIFDFDLDTTNERKSKEIDFKPVLKVVADKKTDIYKLLERTTGIDTGSINVFKLREVYATHFDIVEEIHAKFDENSPNYIKSIAAYLKSIGSSESDFYRFHFGNYHDEIDFHKRPLSKMTKDIYDKMKIINNLFEPR